jgi:predicted transcriptional regulator
MATLETLRNRLIDQILVTKNEKLLQAVSEIFQSTNADEKIDLNSFQIEMIQMGLKDIEEGNTISESDLEKKDAEWMD